MSAPGRASMRWVVSLSASGSRMAKPSANCCGSPRAERSTMAPDRAHSESRSQLDLQMGEIFGFLGPNGGGKNTTIRCLLDVIRSTAGTIRVLGLDARKDGLAIQRRIGYIPGDVRLPGDLTAKQFLDHCSRMAGLSSSRRAVPMNLSQMEFAQGARYGSRTTVTPSERKT